MLKTEVNTLVRKGNPIYNDIKKNQNNFLTLKFFTVAGVVFIKLKEVVGSKLRVFASFIEE